MLPITSPELLGKVLRRYRKNLGLTQTEAGGKFNMTQTTVSQLESGRLGVQLSTLFKMMAALKLEIHFEDRNKTNNDDTLW